jgi:hypothetical protein
MMADTTTMCRMLVRAGMRTIEAGAQILAFVTWTS